jgi:ABC-type transport system involved in cytochrome bd biosynthesis fused ATPase/permease subunit
MTFILETRDLGYSYGDETVALKGVCITIEVGKKIALVGAQRRGQIHTHAHVQRNIAPEHKRDPLQGPAPAPRFCPPSGR